VVGPFLFSGPVLRTHWTKLESLSANLESGGDQNLAIGERSRLQPGERKAGLADRVFELVERLIASHGFECVDVEWLAGSRTLRVYVDRKSSNAAIDLDGCAAVNALLMDVPELDDLITGAYTLEVSSPGIERPLRRLEHFARYVGSEVEVRLIAAAPAEVGLNRRIASGRLLDVSSDGLLTLDVSGSRHAIPFACVEKAKLVYDWDSHAD